MKKQIRESLDVTDMMMGIMPPGRKNSQQIGAVSAAESVTVMDHADRYEQVILNPLLEMLFEFDQQFRTTEIAVETMGEIGIKAKIESVPVPQWGEKIFFRWTGTEYQQGLQRMQQQIAATNVLKGIPPQMLGGKTLDLAPMAEMLAENVFGPELAPRILKDMRNQYKIDPQIENEMLWNSFDVQVHEMDDDPAHLQSHTQAAQINGDPMGLYQAHIMAHMQQMQRKREMAMPQKPGGLPGAPGGAGPGVPGTPRPGALPAPGGPRPAQNPPGAVQPTQMADPRAMG